MFLSQPLTQLLALFFANLCRGVAVQQAGPQGFPSWWGRPSLLPAPAISLIYRRVREIAWRVAVLATRFEAGTLRGRVARVAVVGRLASGKPRPVATCWPYRLRSGFAWLLPLAPGIAPFGGQLGHILEQPKMVRLLEAAPQLRRVLRPLCRMLGVTAAALARPDPPVPDSVQPGLPQPGQVAAPGRSATALPGAVRSMTVRVVGRPALSGMARPRPSREIGD